MSPKLFSPNTTIHTTTGPCYIHPTPDAWPTMLGLLTIISDAIAAAPWWGDGESAPWPEVGSVWVRKDGGIGAVCVTSANADDLVEVVTTTGGSGYNYLDHFLHTWKPATVVPTDEYQAMHERLASISDLERRYSELLTRSTRLAEHAAALSDAFAPGPTKWTIVPTPTADDWIDPAVRLPEVGEWVWVDNGNTETPPIPYVTLVDPVVRRPEWWGEGERWAPILVGPPPIPDASEVE
jgi:hypothetical protein